MFDVVIDVSFIYLYFYILKCEIGHDLSHLIPENPLDRFNDTPMYKYKVLVKGGHASKTALRKNHTGSIGLGIHNAPDLMEAY